MHAALAGEPGAPSRLEPLDRDGLGALVNGMRAHAGVALDLLAGRLGSLDEVVARAGRCACLRRAISCSRASTRSARSRTPAAASAIHGDFHLGQVLRAEEDFVILDFDGDPAQTSAERREKQSPLKDVAGMIRSYSYAGVCRAVCVRRARAGRLRGPRAVGGDLGALDG